MSTTLAVRDHRPSGTTPDRVRPVPIHVLVCGSPDRADDGAPMLAAARIRRNLPPGVQLRLVGQLEVDHLLAIPQRGGVVIVDAATGLRPGVIVELPLAGLTDPSHLIRPRSSHALEIPEVVGVAEMIRGRPLPGRILAIGARSFGLGKTLSASVVKAIPALSAAILAAADHVRDDVIVARES